MRKIYLTLLLGLFLSIAHAQIIAPDTVCKGSVVNFTTPFNSASTYAWTPDNVDISPASMTGVFSGSFKPSLPSAVNMQFDGTNYYLFVTINSGKLLRLNYGSNPFGTYSITDLGNFGGLLRDSTKGMDIVYDNGNWYAMIVSSSRLVRVNFGNSLSNGLPTVTATAMSFPFGTINYGYQLTMVKYNGEWLAFLANRGSNTITRFAFGTSITNTPTFDFISAGFGVFNNPVAFAFQNLGGVWTMLAINRGGGPSNGGMVKVDFGFNLKMVNPNATSLGNPGSPGKLRNPRAVNLITDCDQFYALITNEDGRIIEMDFAGNSLAGSATPVNLGDASIPNNQIYFTSAFWYNNGQLF